MWGSPSQGAPLGTQTVKNLPVMWETRVWSLGQEDPREKGMVTHPVFLPGEFHGQRSLVGYSPWGCSLPGSPVHGVAKNQIGLLTLSLSFTVQNTKRGSLLVVQWLRIHLAMQETWVQSLDGKPRPCMPGAPKPTCVATTKPSHNYGIRTPQWKILQDATKAPNGQINK